MGWDNPPVTWRELERRLPANVTRLPPGPGEAPGTGRPDGGRDPDHVAPAEHREDIPPWAELHCHSSYSFLDGASSPAELVAEACRQGVRALAITDHDGMYGVAQFAQAAARQAEQTGIALQTVFGAELSAGGAGPGGLCWPGGRPPGTPRLPAGVPAVLARGGDPPEPPATRCGARRTPAARPGLTARDSLGR